MKRCNIFSAIVVLTLLVLSFLAGVYWLPHPNFLLPTWVFLIIETSFITIGYVLCAGLFKCLRDGCLNGWRA